MNLIRWNTQPTLSNLLDNFFERDINTAFNSRRESMPATNIIDKKNEFELEIAVPGMKKEDFKINLENNLLTISSEKKEEGNVEDKNYTSKEFCYCSFSRSFTLPKVVDPEKICAEYNQGILKVSLPKKAEEPAKASKEIQIA